jgi:transposase
MPRGRPKLPTLYALRLKVKAEASPWLERAAGEVNQVWNWANQVSMDAADRNRRANPEWLSGFDLNKLSSGATEYFEHVGADTIQKLNQEYATRRRQFKKFKLRWRVSRGPRRSLGWVPFKAASLRRSGRYVRFCGKTFRFFEAERLDEITWGDGTFAQDALGDWWLCLSVKQDPHWVGPPCPARRKSVGIDLGLKDIAVSSKGERLEAGRWTTRYAEELACAQRRGHKRRAKRIHRKIARCRQDAVHKFTSKIIDTHQNVFVGDVSSPKLARTRMAKSVLDSAWGLLRTQLQYKGKHAGRGIEVVSERNTTRDCSVCGESTGPSGHGGLVVRRWTCVSCGAVHDRDCNSAISIDARGQAIAGLRCEEVQTSQSTQVLGKEPPSAGTSLKGKRVEHGTPAVARQDPAQPLAA